MCWRIRQQRQAQCRRDRPSHGGTVPIDTNRQGLFSRTARGVHAPRLASAARVTAVALRQKGVLMSRRFKAGLIPAVLLAALGIAAPASAAAAPSGHYDHIFVIVEENHGFSDVIGNPAAPNLNALAARYGLATGYFGVSHPSEPNYVGLLGGDTFGVADDNPYYVNRVHAPSLVSQLDHAGIGWKAYLQGAPHPGYQGICYPANCNGSPDKDPLYVSKHNGIGNFTTSLDPADWARQVPVDQLASDVRRGTVPAFGWVIPDECHDQ